MATKKYEELVVHTKQYNNIFNLLGKDSKSKRQIIADKA